MQPLLLMSRRDNDRPIGGVEIVWLKGLEFRLLKLSRQYKNLFFFAEFRSWQCPEKFGSLLVEGSRSPRQG